jgi:hypothetical protein
MHDKILLTPSDPIGKFFGLLAPSLQIPLRAPSDSKGLSRAVAVRLLLDQCFRRSASDLLRTGNSAHCSRAWQKHMVYSISFVLFLSISLVVMNSTPIPVSL